MNDVELDRLLDAADDQLLRALDDVIDHQRLLLALMAAGDRPHEEIRLSLATMSMTERLTKRANPIIGASVAFARLIEDITTVSSHCTTLLYVQEEHDYPVQRLFVNMLYGNIGRAERSCRRLADIFGCGNRCNRLDQRIEVLGNDLMIARRSMEIGRVFGVATALAIQLEQFCEDATAIADRLDCAAGELLGAAESSGLGMALLGVLDDFTEADFSELDVWRLDLNGVRWAEWGTRWPPGFDVKRLKIISEPEGAGIYVVRGGVSSDWAALV